MLMSPPSTTEILNRLLVLHMRSLPMYLSYAPPYELARYDKAKAVLDQIVADQRRTIDRLGTLVIESGGTADYGEYYRGTGAGFVDWVWGSHAAFERHSHQITNILIELRDEDHAVSEAYVTAALRQRTGDGRVVDITSRGRYIDRWSCRDGRWAIDHRINVGDIQTVRTSSADVADDSASTARRDGEDPSYAVFGN